MNFPLCYILLGGIALQRSIALASSAGTVSLPAKSSPLLLSRTLRSSTTPWAPQAMKEEGGSWRINGARRATPIAFATRRQSSRCGHNCHACFVSKPLSIVAGSQPRFAPAPTRYSTSNRLFMAPEHREHYFVGYSLPLLCYCPWYTYYFYDLVTFTLASWFMYATVSYFMSKPEEERGESSLGLEAGAGNDKEVENDDILTPKTYADAMSAERQVNDTIVHTASQAFGSTDFAHEPHLSAEVEDAEVAYEVALLATAAHELADAAEKENRQSKAAMMERERELEWIEKPEDERGETSTLVGVEAAAGGGNNIGIELGEDDILTPGTYADAESAKRQVKDAITQMASQAFDSTDFEHEPHLSPELENAECCDLEDEDDAGAAAMKANDQEAFQRSLLAARIANDVKVKELFVGQQRKEDWMGSEARAASIGGPEYLPFDKAGAAASEAAAHALAEADVLPESEEGNAMDEGRDSPPAAAASMIADTAERMILGEDLAAFEHSPTGLPAQSNEQTQILEVDEVRSEVDQWREEYVRDIRKVVQAKAIEETKEKMSRRNSNGNDRGSDGGDYNVDYIDTSGTTSSTKDLAVKPGNSDNVGVMKRSLKRGLLKRIRERRTFLVVALAVVISRRLFLAYFGNASRLI